MECRELEVIFLKKILEVNPNIQVIPFEDLRFQPKLRLPRVISRTKLSKENTYRPAIKGERKEITIYRHNITFTFVLDSTMSNNNVVDIYNVLKHKIKNDWESMRNGKNYVLVEVGDIQDISEITNHGITGKFVFEISVNSQKETNYNISLIKKIEFELGGVK